MPIGDIIFEDIPTLAAAFNRAYARMPPKTYGGRIRARKSKVRKTTPFKKYNKTSLVNRAKTKALIKLIKQVTLSQSETCYRSKSVQVLNYYHDTVRPIDIWGPGNLSLWPPQGLSDGERKGDEIYTTGIMYRGVFQIPFDRRNTQFKMWYVPYNTEQGDSAVYNNFFHNVTGDGIIDPVQTDRWKGIKYLGKFKARSVDQNLTEVGNDKTIHIKRWIPIKKKITFINDGSQQPSNMQEVGRLIVLPYDAISTFTTDIVITRSENCFTLYFKDP